jgi:hypothetical protein
MGQLRNLVSSGSIGNNLGSRSILNQLNRLFVSTPIPMFLDNDFSITRLVPSRTNFLEFSAGEIELSNNFILELGVNHIQGGKITSVTLTLE